MFVPIYYFTLFAAAGCSGSYVIIHSKSSNVTFKYSDGINGESDLHECEVNEACNVLHDRFWVSSLTERLCRCSNGIECPWQWTKELGNSSVSLNNKSRMEVCPAATELSVCAAKQQAIKVYGKSDRNNSYLIPSNVTVYCKCPESRYWRLQKYAYGENDLIEQTFTCAKKKTCDSREFCGHIRSDLYSAYHRCTCPQNHLCIFEDRAQENVQELLYSGPAYKAYCLPLGNS